MRNHLKSALLLLATLSLCFAYAADSPQNSGHFAGNVETKWLVENGEDRRMELLSEFSYIDPNGKKWTTPKGWIVDGASIPRFLWTLVGSPFTGGYRRASVVHDYYCDKKNEPWQAVHKMFYWASLAGGASEVEAKILYAGVFAGGPRWKDVHFSNHPPRIKAEPGDFDSIEVVPWQPSVSEEKIEELQDWIKNDNPSLDQIEERAAKEITQNEPRDYVRIPRTEVELPRMPRF